MFIMIFRETRIVFGIAVEKIRGLCMKKEKMILTLFLHEISQYAIAEI